MSGNPKTDLTKLELLAGLLRDDDVDIEKLNGTELAQYLSENNVAMAEPQKRFEAILKRADARRRLEAAAKRRIEVTAKAKGILSTGAHGVRERVRELIEKFKQRDPDMAQIYAREFEKATPEDLATIEEDLTLLETKLHDASD